MRLLGPALLPSGEGRGGLDPGLEAWGGVGLAVDGGCGFC